MGTFIFINTGGGGTSIPAVANYDALVLAYPPPNSVHLGQYVFCENSQGTSWLPGPLLGTYYPAGVYYCNGVDWKYANVPYQATQAEVDAGVVEDKFVSPKTFNDSLQLTQASILSKLGIWNIQDQTAGSNSILTTLTITKSIALPSVPSFLNFRAVFFKTGSNGTYTIRAYLSEVDNNIGGTAIQIAVVTGANIAVNNLPMKRTFDIIGGNIIGLQAGNSQVTDDINSSSVRLNTPIPTGPQLYLIFAVQCINALDLARFESAQINNFTF